MLFNRRKNAFFHLKGATMSFRNAFHFYFYRFRVLGPTREFFIHNMEITMTGEGLQLLTYTLHSWPLSCKGSLVYYTYCDTGHQFIIVISNDHHTHTCSRALGSGVVTTCMFKRLRSVATGDRTLISRLYKLSHRVGFCLILKYPFTN